MRLRSVHPGTGLRGNSDGRGPAELGVLRVGRVGLRVGDAEGMTAKDSRYLVGERQCQMNDSRAIPTDRGSAVAARRKGGKMAGAVVL